MSYLLSVLSAGFVLIGIVVLLRKESCLRLPRFDGPNSSEITGAERGVVGGTFLFVGILLSVTTYSIVAKGNPYWFIDHVFGLFT